MSVQNHAERRGLHKHLRRKLGCLPAIEQAKGIIMCLRRCDQDTAFAELLHAAQESNRRLRDIALALVAYTACQPDPQSDQTIDEIVARYWAPRRIAQTGEEAPDLDCHQSGPGDLASR